VKSLYDASNILNDILVVSRSRSLSHGALIRYSRKSAALFTLELTCVAFAKNVALSASSLFGSVSMNDVCVPCDKEMHNTNIF
jgi:hypothetical protein